MKRLVALRGVPNVRIAISAARSNVAIGETIRPEEFVSRAPELEARLE